MAGVSTDQLAPPEGVRDRGSLSAWTFGGWGAQRGLASAPGCARFGPVAILALGATGAWLLTRRRVRPAPAPLSDEERRRLAQLMEGEAP